MALETGTYISDLKSANPDGGTDTVNTLDNHIRLLKSTILASFPNITGAMTASHSELNSLDGYTGNTNDLNILSGSAAGGMTSSDLAILSGAASAGVTSTEFQYLNGVTSAIQTQLNARLSASNNLSDLNNAATALDNIGIDGSSGNVALGDLATSIRPKNVLDEGTFSGASISINNVFSDHDLVEIEFDSLYAGSGTELLARLGYSTGTYYTSNYDSYNYINYTSASGGGSTYLYLGANSLSTDSAYRTRGKITIWNPSLTGVYPFAAWKIYNHAAGNYYIINGCGKTTASTANALTSIHFAILSGTTFSGGNYRVIGYRT